MSVYEDVKCEIGNVQAIGGNIEEVQLAEDIQEELSAELGVKNHEGARFVNLYNYPVTTTKRGTGVKVKYH